MSKKHLRENDTVVVEEGSGVSEVALREEAVQAFWEEKQIFEQSVSSPAGRAPVGEYVFYDGPPFATGTPHYGHILAGTIKDAIPRFWTMHGKRVERTWGWDCHGLPLENLIEKKLGLANKREIEEYGIQRFNEAARSAVMEYADDWKEIVPRLGRFADMEDDYKTMDRTYTESVWWVFSELHKKGLVYEGFKSMHLCPRCGTTLSNFEVNLGYKDIKDIAVTVKLPLLDEAGKKTDTSLLVWTTTPWTLPGNMAAAVHKEFVYARVKVVTEEGAEYLVLAKGRLAQLGDTEYEVVGELRGEELVGRSYEPPFPYLKDQVMEGKENAWKIYHADYVELGEEGTGAVHLAPAYGEEDMVLAQAHGIPLFHHVNYEGRFKDFVTDFAGKLVKPKDDEKSDISHLDTDIEIVKALKASGKLFKKENITHSYPHCWRDDTPLLNYATTSWFVKVTDIKDQLVAANNAVHWVPEHVGKNRFGKWLEGARDWAVSRQRYWGAPLPIWKHPTTGAYTVFGSKEALIAATKKSGNTYLLMRHGESVSNVEGKVQTIVGTPNPLTENGVADVKRAAEALRGRGITKIITSPFERTRETARIVAETLGLENDRVTIDERLREISLAEYEGRSNQDYHDLLTQADNWSQAAPEGGESWADVRNRIGECLYELEHQCREETILIVSHNAPLRLASVVAHGAVLSESDFDHDADGKRFLNAEVRELMFVPLPHNDHYELDYHRPYIDAYPVLAGDGTPLVRVPDVFDCWFESGAMPYGQHHYPFVDAERFLGERFPAQFIAEGLDQTRGWFYSLMVLGVALFGKSPYENVIVNGLVLAEDGKKMSKSLRNYPDPMELVNRVGADAVRFYLLSSPVIRGEDLNFSEKEVTELQRKNIGRLHNVLALYETYATGGAARSTSTRVLDQWIMSRLNELIQEATSGYEMYELDRATRPITDFIDDLSVWYVRRSRERLKSDDEGDKDDALATLRYVLKTLALVMAPAMPFYAEYLWGRVRSEEDAESVHLAAWPKGGDVDEQLHNRMSAVRLVVTSALEARTKAGVKVRQPLASLVFQKDAIHHTHDYEALLALIRDEVNVKEVTGGDDLSGFVWLDTTITSALQAEGDMREFMRAVQDIRKGAGLMPQDRVELIVQASVEGETLLTAHKELHDLLLKTVGATMLTFDVNSGTDVAVRDITFRVAVRAL